MSDNCETRCCLIDECKRHSVDDPECLALGKLMDAEKEIQRLRGELDRESNCVTIWKRRAEKAEREATTMREALSEIKNHGTDMAPAYNNEVEWYRRLAWSFQGIAAQALKETGGD